MATINILEPVGEVKRREGEVIPLSSLGGVKGKRIAFVSNEWRFLAAVWETLGDSLRRQGVGETFKVVVPGPRPASAETLKEVTDRADAAIVGIAN